MPKHKSPKKATDSFAFIDDNMIVDKSALGKLITCPLPHGLIFCLAWVPTKLGDDVMKIQVAPDGMSMQQLTKTPRPENGSDLVEGMYPWGSDRNNVVVAHTS